MILITNDNSWLPYEMKCEYVYFTHPLSWPMVCIGISMSQYKDSSIFCAKKITSGLIGTNEDNYGSLIEIYFDLRNLNIFY